MSLGRPNIALSGCESLPQTPAGGVGGKGGGGSGVPGSGMVNGAGADHQDIRDGAAINTEHVSNLMIIIFTKDINNYYYKFSCVFR
ncbi:hypothetical protein M0802_016191 [Mischocyttarus mexicanus]|nr:hypothetical protein M0802_016191 [Mischocyttarus mexicanus]